MNKCINKRCTNLERNTVVEVKCKDCGRTCVTIHNNDLYLEALEVISYYSLDPVKGDRAQEFLEKVRK